MALLDGKVAIVTGAGGGLGRAHALALARAGARVVINDLGSSLSGHGADPARAEAVVGEVEALGSQAIADGENVADFEGARRLVEHALDAFGRLDILVNNAGILRDRMLVNMDEAEWDAVIAVHLKGHFAPTRHAAAYWRERAKAGEQLRARVINTASPSGVFGNAGQANYGAAKAGIAAFSTIAAMELGRYGVRSNAITPMARTRMTEETPGLEDIIKAPTDAAQFDAWDPANISPMIAYLATVDCPFTGEVFFVQGDTVCRYQPFAIAERITNNGLRWTVERLIEEAPKLAPVERRGGPGELARASGG
jgi:NAD(P)-dependent dehydrogenase (short-subunit alcohol dehydrogenase family)